MSATNSLSFITTINWSFSGKLVFNTDFDPGGSIWVTGPDTIAFLVLTTASGVGSPNQQPVGTTEQPIYLPLEMAAPTQNIPFEYAAAMVSNWTNTALWLNLPFVCSDACIVSIAQWIAANIGSTNEILLEMGNEHWNLGAAVRDRVGMGNFAVRIWGITFPSGQSIYPHFTPSGSTASYLTTGTEVAEGNQGIY